MMEIMETQEQRERVGRLLNKAHQCMSINNKANDLLKFEDYSVFRKAELCTIAELSANEAMKLRRDANEIVANCEKELKILKHLLEEERTESE